MIRQKTENGWLLLGHQDHARLAGAFAQAWGNATFIRPEPFDPIGQAVAMHDDSWAERDARPLVTPEGFPSAFSKELVGTYDAFEEIDLEGYLRVRGRATEAVAEVSPYAAILVSMHTVNLLTEQADLSGLSEDALAVHGAFVEGQRERQEALKQTVRASTSDPVYASEDTLATGFRFLQCCDSLSLMVCTDFPHDLPLRHAQPTAGGKALELRYEPLSGNRYRVAPWPFREEETLDYEIPALRVKGNHFADQPAFDVACAAGEQIRLSFSLVP